MNKGRWIRFVLSFRNVESVPSLNVHLVGELQRHHPLTTSCLNSRSLWKPASPPWRNIHQSPSLRDVWQSFIPSIISIHRGWPTPVKLQFAEASISNRKLCRTWLTQSAFLACIAAVLCWNILCHKNLPPPSGLLLPALPVPLVMSSPRSRLSQKKAASEKGSAEERPGGVRPRKVGRLLRAQWRRARGSHL